MKPQPINHAAHHTRCLPAAASMFLGKIPRWTAASVISTISGGSRQTEQAANQRHCVHKAWPIAATHARQSQPGGLTNCNRKCYINGLFSVILHIRSNGCSLSIINQLFNIINIRGKCLHFFGINLSEIARSCLFLVSLLRLQ